MIQTRLQDALAEMLIQGALADGDTITVDVAGEELSIRGSREPAAEPPSA